MRAILLCTAVLCAAILIAAHTEASAADPAAAGAATKPVPFAESAVGQEAVEQGTKLAIGQRTNPAPLLPGAATPDTTKPWTKPTGTGQRPKPPAGPPAKPLPVAQGVKVMPKAEAVVKMGEQTIDLSRTPVPWTVQNVSGEFLLVGYQEKGWVLRSDVVTLDEAPAYYEDILDHVNDAKKAALAYRDRAVVWHQKGELDLEIADYTERLRLDPDSLTYNNRGIAWTKKKDFAKAIADFSQAIRLDPGHVRAWDNRGIAYSGAKDYDRALKNHQQAMQLDPNLASAHNNAAWLLATCPEQRLRDGRLAIELATKACDLSVWSSANNCGTLAAAYAETGDFDSAIKFQTKAIGLGSNQPAFVSGANLRLQLYREHKPYRDQ